VPPIWRETEIFVVWRAGIEGKASHPYPHPHLHFRFASYSSSIRPLFRPFSRRTTRLNIYSLQKITRMLSARYLALAHVLTPFASPTSLIRSTAATWPVRNQANFKQQILEFWFAAIFRYIWSRKNSTGSSGMDIIKKIQLRPTLSFKWVE